MGRIKRGGRWSNWMVLLLLLVLIWFVQQGRYYLPKYIRPPKGVEPIEVGMKVTAYCHCGKCCSYKWFGLIPYQKTGFLKYRIKQIGKTSSGATARPGTIAADTTRYPYGTVMHIPGYGYVRVEDTGGAIGGQRIDLFRPSHRSALNWGVRRMKVKVWLPSNKGRETSYVPEPDLINEAERLPLLESTV